MRAETWCLTPAFSVRAPAPKRGVNHPLAAELTLRFSFAVPFGGAIVGDFLQGLDEDATEAVAAVEGHTDELGTDFIDASAAGQNLAADFFHAHRDFDESFGSDAEICL